MSKWSFKTSDIIIKGMLTQWQGQTVLYVVFCCRGRWAFQLNASICCMLDTRELEAGNKAGAVLSGPSYMLLLPLGVSGLHVRELLSSASHQLKLLSKRRQQLECERICLRDCLKCKFKKKKIPSGVHGGKHYTVM